MTDMLLAVLLAVLNSLWEAVLAAGLVWGALRLFTKFGVALNAATRYVIWWVVLAVVLALPLAPGLSKELKRMWASHTQQAAVVADPVRERRLVIPVTVELPAPVMLPEPKSARWQWWILALAASLFVYRIDQIARSYFYLRGLKRRAAESDQTMPATERPVRLLVSREVASPMAVGFLHPAVVLPDSLMAELSAAELEHVLLHEVAHIARRDDWTNLAARVLGALLALHPVAWWILRQIEREREIACDDWVVARTGSARPYAASLARLSELRWSRKSASGEALASGILGGGSRAGERIELLLRRGREFSSSASRMRVAVSFVALFGFVIAASVAPRWIAFAQELRFEVASVKVNKGGPPIGPGIRRTPGRFVGTNVTARALIREAYGLKDYQLSGGPAWLDADRFDVEGKAADAAGDDQLREMLRTVMTERFQLQVHRETKEMAVYDMLVGKNPPKFPEVKPGQPRPAQPPRKAEATATVMANSYSALANALSTPREMGRPVIDQTGLTGTYLIELQIGPDEDVLTALQEAGLRLESARGSIEVVVIDRVEMPDAN